jgi:hypothetical protein
MQFLFGVVNALIISAFCMPLNSTLLPVGVTSHWVCRYIRFVLDFGINLSGQNILVWNMQFDSLKEGSKMGTSRKIVSPICDSLQEFYLSISKCCQKRVRIVAQEGRFI